MKRTNPLLLVIASLCLAASLGAQTFIGANVGNPQLAGSVTSNPDGTLTIVGGGDDIWNASDNFYYYYTSVTGQVWEAKVRVRDLQGPDWWSKCELMVRVPDASGTPKGPDAFFAAMVTRTAGQNQLAPQWRATRGGGADWNAFDQTIAPPYPDAWLRITRSGSVLSMWHGTDGVNWTKYCDINTARTGWGFGQAFPDPLLVGVAVTAHNNTDPTGGIAVVSDLSVTVTPHVPTLTALTQVQDATTYVGCNAFFSFAATNSALANSPLGAGNYRWYKNDQLQTSANTAQYGFLAAAGDQGAKVYCTASLPGAATITSATGTVTVLAATEYEGVLKYEYFPGSSRAALLAGSYGPPARVSARTSSEAPWDYADNYGARLSGLFVPPADGNYTFFIAADDDADLYLGTNASPASAQLIAQEVGWSPRNNWVTMGGGPDGANMKKRSDLWSPDGMSYPGIMGYPLVGGQKYFIAAVHREGNGGDNLSILWKLASDPDPVDGDQPNLTGSQIRMLTWAPTYLNITQQPVDKTVFEGLDVVLSVAVTTDAELTPVYQWQRNQANLPGKNTPTISFPAVLADHGAKYRCVITLPGTGMSVTSDEITLTVQASVFITGLVKQEIWGPNNSSFTRVGVENDAYGPPNTSRFITVFDTSDFADNYVQRLSTWFRPPQNGNYVFLISSDDDCDLFVSTTDDPVDKRLVAQQTGWNGNREWSTATGQRSSASYTPDNGATYPYSGGITMNANQQYYIEAVHHEGAGGDNLSVYFLLLGDAVPANGTPSNLQGQRVGLKLPAPTSLALSSQPQDTSVSAWHQAIFTVGVTTDALYPPTYQWRKKGSAIANATTSVYSLLTSTNDNGASFDCIVTLSAYGSVTSAPALLTVRQDTQLVSGRLREEYFPAASLDALVYGNIGAPSQLNLWTIFESRTNIADNFSRRVSGFFIPDETADYVFLTSSDDASNVYISTDDQPRNKYLIAQQGNWNGARIWDTATGQRSSETWSPDGGMTMPYSAGIHLLAGNRYYIEGIHREGGGGDNFAVTFKKIGEANPADGTAPLLTGSLIAYMQAPPTLTITPSGANVVISWSPGGGHLESSPVLGPDAVWTSEGAANPRTLPATGAKYFKVVIP